MVRIGACVGHELDTPAVFFIAVQLNVAREASGVAKIVQKYDFSSTKSAS